MAKEFNWVQGLTLVCAILLLVGSFAWFAPATIPTPVNQVVDLTGVDSKLASIDGKITALDKKVNSVDTTINEEKLWKQEAIDLATAEWSQKGYKDVFDVLRHIDEKQDIEKIVVKDAKVTDLSVDDKEATVTQELKVYYEDDQGDRKKAFVTITTTIIDGEVDNQEIELN